MTLLRDLDITALDMEDPNTKYALGLAKDFDAYIGHEVHVDAQDCCLSVSFTAVFLGSVAEIDRYHPSAPREGEFLSHRGYAFDNGVTATGTEVESAIRGDAGDMEGAGEIVEGATVAVTSLTVDA